MYERTSVIIRDFYAHFKTFPGKNSKTYIRVVTAFISLHKPEKGIKFLAHSKMRKKLQYTQKKAIVIIHEAENCAFYFIC